jgi:hypothetical protein
MVVVSRALLVALALVPGLASAEGETQVWSSLTAQLRAPEGGVAGWLDLHTRRRNGSTLLIARPAIGYGFGKLLTLHAGYAYVRSYTDEGPDGIEHRTWQQALINYPVSSALKVQGRFRPEQRFGGGDDTGHRIRLLGRAQYQWCPRLELQVVVWDELFVQLNDTERFKSGFDQNRAFIGLGTDTKLKGLRFEAGYTNIYFESGRIDHAVAVNALLTIAP